MRDVKTILRMLAPYFAVIPLWCVYRNAWLCILVYHAQALLWSRADLNRVRRGWNRNLFLIGVLPCALAGPLAFFLLPIMMREVSLGTWLSEAGLGGVSLLVMVPYFGLVHPLIEQAHWNRLRSETHWAHVAFAAYHVLVLWSLLQPAWLALCFAVLLGASIGWTYVQRKPGGGLLAPYCMHAAADLGIVAAAWLLVVGLSIPYSIP